MHVVRKKTRQKNMVEIISLKKAKTREETARYFMYICSTEIRIDGYEISLGI